MARVVFYHFASVFSFCPCRQASRSMAGEGSVSCNSQPAVAPVARYSHVAVDIDSKLYVWGGWRKDTPRIHSGEKKTDLTSIVDVLDLQVAIIKT